MLKIALTGGLASGKSTVADCFAARGVPVIDTDIIAHELVEPGQPALAPIVAAFGPQALDPQGRLDRAWLRDRVFADPAQRTRLETILHPLIHQEVVRRIAELRADYCMVVVPLLVECAQQYPVDRVLVVDVPEAVQRSRAARRDALDPALIDAILAAQATRAQRLEHADDVITNDTGLTDLDRRVADLHAQYRRFARAKLSDP